MKHLMNRGLSLGWAVSVLCLACSDPAWAAPARYVLDSAQSNLRFEAKTTLHDFGGEARTFSGELEWDSQAHTIGETAVVRVPVAPIKTGVAPRDRSMRRMFDAPTYPQIEFRATGLTPAETGHYKLAGILKIRNVEHAIELNVAEKDRPDGSFEVEGDTVVSVDAFELKPPVAFGVVRVLPDIRIHFKSVWTLPKT